MWSCGAPPAAVPNSSRPFANKALMIPRRRSTSVALSSLPPTPDISVSSPPPTPDASPPKAKKYRKLYPGERKGITEEMRFVAMRLRRQQEEGTEGDIDGGSTWQPSMEGFLMYLVDSRLVFDTIESIVEQSDDENYSNFRKTGLERTQCLLKDIEHFSHLGLNIPEPGSPGASYAKYLKEIATTSPPSFLSHFYNIYFAHVSGGQVIGEQVSQMLLDGRKLEFYKWEGDAQEMLKDVRDNLNKLGERWRRDDKNQCLKEAAKCFRLSGQILRLIVK